MLRLSWAVTIWSHQVFIQYNLSRPFTCFAFRMIYLGPPSSSTNPKLVAGATNCDHTGQSGRTGRTRGTQAALHNTEWGTCYTSEWFKLYLVLIECGSHHTEHADTFPSFLQLLLPGKDTGWSNTVIGCGFSLELLIVGLFFIRQHLVILILINRGHI